MPGYAVADCGNERTDPGGDTRETLDTFGEIDRRAERSPPRVSALAMDGRKLPELFPQASRCALDDQPAPLALDQGAGLVDDQRGGASAS